MSRKHLYTISISASIITAAVAAASLLTGPASAAPKQIQAPPTVVIGPDSGPGGWSEATCPAGTQLAGGGYESVPIKDGYGNPVDALTASAPSLNPNAWLAHMDRGSVRATAMCVASSAPPPTIVTGPPGTAGYWSIATCPPGTVLAGGGFIATAIAHNGLGNPVDTETGATATMNPPNSWADRWFAGTVIARAMCTS